MATHTKSWWTPLCLGVALLSAALPGCDRAEPAAELPALETYWPAPDFALVDQAGNPVTRDSLRGQVWAASFFFARCPSICTVLMPNMRQLSESLADSPEGAAIRLVSFTLDPEHDRGPALAEFAAAQGATPDRWLLLTGEKPAVWSISNDGFKLAVDATPDQPDNPISHTAKVVLVDQQGMIRGFYDGLAAEEVANLGRDLRRLAAQP